MAYTYTKKSPKHNTIAVTIVTVLVIFSVFASLIASYYAETETEAYNLLHTQTKQIKDDLSLQIKSDNENLVTMASFAAKLYDRGEDYSLMFDSFKPIGLFSRIGIMTPDCVFTTKEEAVDLSETVSFEEEVLLGQHITGRTYSYSIPDEEVIRSAVPIQVNGETVGIIYGVIKIETLNEKYIDLLEELNAKLFVYDKETGKFIIDSTNKRPGELSQFKSRVYKDGYSYEQLATSNEGFSSFKSVYAGEDMYVHYSTLWDLNWGIMLARYETQVFANAHRIAWNMVLTFGAMILALLIYLYIIINTERNRTRIATQSADIRRLLLEVNKKHQNIDEALKKVKLFLGAKTAFFIDTDGADYNDNFDTQNNLKITGEDRKYLISELFEYAARIKNRANSGVSYMKLVPDGHLCQTNKKLYNFLKSYGVNEISFAIISEENNHASVLGVVNSKKQSLVKPLLADTAICFSIAVYNNNNLNKTELVATTDALTGALNRVAYKKDIFVIDEEKPGDFACVYIDVNELNLINNTQGHSAGDEMLIYIANSLKEVFFGHYVYRMGGDEFLVFAKGIMQSAVNEKIDTFFKQLELKNYTASVGLSYRTQCFDCEEMVREAEIRMYESKAQYYQNKEKNNDAYSEDEGFEHLNTGIKEIDTMISVLREHYYGIFKVSLNSDSVHRVLTPAYIGHKGKDKRFSELLLSYINDSVHQDSRRVLMSFLNYDVLKRQLKEGKIPSATFKSLTGEVVKLSVYSLNDEKDDVTDTLWIFAKN